MIGPRMHFQQHTIHVPTHHLTRCDAPIERTLVRAGDFAEAAGLIIAERLLDLGLRVHHEGSVARNGLAIKATR
jgi:hypothetical protein